MNRYKKELYLQGYTKLPTIKNLYNKNHKHIAHFDNYEIRSVKSAINELMRVKPIMLRKVTFIFKGYEKVFHIVTMNMKMLQAILKHKRLLESQNNCEVKIKIERFRYYEN